MYVIAFTEEWVAPGPSTGPWDDRDNAMSYAEHHWSHRSWVVVEVSDVPEQ